MEDKAVGILPRGYEDGCKTYILCPARFTGLDNVDASISLAVEALEKMEFISLSENTERKSFTRLVSLPEASSEGVTSVPEKTSMFNTVWKHIVVTYVDLVLDAILMV